MSDDNQTTDRCPFCRGKGYVAGDPEGKPIEDCDWCGGSGELPVLRIGEIPRMSESRTTKWYCHKCGREVPDFSLERVEAEGFDPATCDVLCDACGGCIYENT